MQLTPILVCLGLISVVQATMHRKMFKPRLNLVHYYNFKTSETSKRALPEERRKLSIFPKSNKKFVVSLESQYNRSPVVSVTKKPVMKKLVTQDKRPDEMHVQHKIRHPITGRNAQLMHENNLDMFQKAKPYIISEENSAEIVKEKSEESFELQNDNLQEDDTIKKDDKELKTISAEDNFKLIDNISLPHLKAIENNSEKTIQDMLLDTSPILNKSEEGNKFADEKEYIFINPSVKDQTSTEDPDEFVTTEEVPKIYRMKRSDNVIEEENLGTTVAGYKYTWRDTKLNNDLLFKNINS